MSKIVKIDEMQTSKAIQWGWNAMAFLCILMFCSILIYQADTITKDIMHHKRSLMFTVNSALNITTNINNEVVDLQELKLTLANSREELFNEVGLEIDVESEYLEYIKGFERCKSTEENVMFLKTHKTGSSTITSILNRYADLHELTMLLPKNKLNRFMWPQLFKATSVERTYLIKDKQANVLANHARMNKIEMSKVMKPGTKYITILRDPVQQFESSFTYFGFDKLLRIRGSNNPMSVFLKNPEEFFQKLLSKRRKDETLGLLRNGMLYDLGFQTTRVNPTLDIAKAIQKVEEEFDLVLITEYFDESLVLLMRSFCWTFEDILYLKQNARTKKKNSISAENIERIKQWNEGDYKLYQTFNQTFWRKIEEQGDSFWDDLKEFKSRNEMIKQHCGIVKFKSKAFKVKVTINDFKLGEKASEFHIPFCRKLLQNEIDYISYFRKRYDLEKKHYYSRRSTGKSSDRWFVTDDGS